MERLPFYVPFCYIVFLIVVLLYRFDRKALLELVLLFFRKKGPLTYVNHTFCHASIML